MANTFVPVDLTINAHNNTKSMRQNSNILIHVTLMAVKHLLGLDLLGGPTHDSQRPVRDSKASNDLNDMCSKFLCKAL